MRRFKYALALTALTSSCVAFAQQSIIAERVSKLVQLHPLERLTFGPDDNFQPAALGDGKQILLIQKTHMNPQISVLDLKTRERKVWRSDLRDADQVEVGPNGSDVVFRSLDRSPDGDICVIAGLTESIHCLSLPAGEKASPFWISKNRIGYLRKERSMAGFKLESYDLSSNQRVELNIDRLFHPSVDQQGKRLAWIEQIARQRSKQRIQYAAVTETGIGQRCSVELGWPGLSAYPRFSQDGAYLIFSHYLSDTNHDGRIDGEDNAILARMKLPENGCVAPGIIPEPLTSLSENCSQPNVTGKDLIVACAFEGSLDLYRLPETGVIPVDWGPAELTAAHASARSPEDRLLFLLSLYAKSEGQRPQLLRGIFAQHLLLDDESGAIEWLDKMKVQDQVLPNDANIFDKMLRAGELRKTEPTGELSITLRQKLEASLGELKKSTPVFLATAARARIQRLSSGNAGLARAKAELESLQNKKSENDLSFLLMSREWDLLAARLPLNEELYQKVLIASPLRPESQLIYWAKSLTRMSLANKNREAVLTKLVADTRLSNDVRKLIELELLSVKVARKEEKAYLNFDKVFSPERDKPLLVRLAGYRAIQLWTQSDLLKEVEFVTTNLLKYIPTPSLEATYARDYYIATAFDRAYDYVSAKNPTAALGHFYGAVTLTDDLEAHWGYLTMMVAAQRTQLIDRNIDDLKKRRFLDINEDLVRMYADLAKRQGQLPENPEAWLKKAKDVEKISHPFAEFLRGSVRLQWVLETPAMKVEAQREQLETARLELILALDGSRDNQRLKAQTLTNLGILGSESKIWGPAQRWWQERLELPFETELERQLAVYLRAQALIGLQDFQQASALLDSVAVDPNSELAKAFLHLRVQAAAFSGQHEKVLQLTEKQKNNFDNMNDLRLGLLQGRSYLRLKQNEKACSILGKVDSKLAPMTSVIPEGLPNGNTVQRLQILVRGFLSQCGGTESIARMQSYRDLLGIDLATQKRLALEELNFIELRLKNQIRLWMAKGDLSVDSVDGFIKDLESHRAEAGQLVTLGQFEGLYAVGSLALTSATKPNPEQIGEIKTRIDSFTNSAKLALARSDLLIAQRLKLEAVKMKLDGMTAADFTRWVQNSSDLRELGDRNQFLAQKTKESLEWMQRLP